MRSPGVNLSLGTIDESYLPQSGKWKIGLSEYLPATGHRPLVNLICERESVDEACVVITAGASLGLTCAFSIAPRSGSILLPKPFYPAYRSIIEILGRNISHYDLFGVDSEEKIVDRILDMSTFGDVGSILVNVPGNPLGNILGQSALDRIKNHVIENEKLLIVDETYADLVFDPTGSDWKGEGVSEQVIRVKSFSKNPMMAGARIGYIVAPESISKVLRRTQWAISMGPSSTSQLLAARHLREVRSGCETDFISRLRKARDTAFDALVQGGLSGIDKPRAGVFLWVPTGILGLTGAEAARLCAEKANVHVMPAESFGIEHGIRISFASTPEENLRSVFSSIAKALTDRDR